MIGLRQQQSSMVKTTNLMEHARPLGLAALLLASFLGASAANAQSTSSQLAVQQGALKSVLEAADRICQTVPPGESKTTLQLSGDAKAEVSKLLKKLVGLGVSGAAKYQSEKATGVLQGQLAETIAKSNDCKRDVLHTLQGMIPGLEPAGLQKSSKKQQSAITASPTTRNSASVGINNGVVAPGATIIEPASTQPAPDIRLQFLRPAEPALFVENTSDAVAHDVIWDVIVWDIDRSSTPDQWLLEAKSEFRFLRAHDRAGPDDILSNMRAIQVRMQRDISQLPQKGDRLYGTASVQCSDCKRGRTYRVFMRWGEQGWISEIEDITDGHPRIPIFPITREKVETFVRWVDSVSADSRESFSEQ